MSNFNEIFNASRAMTVRQFMAFLSAVRNDSEAYKSVDIVINADNSGEGFDRALFDANDYTTDDDCILAFDGGDYISASLDTLANSYIERAEGDISEGGITLYLEDVPTSILERVEREDEGDVWADFIGERLIGYYIHDYEGDSWTYLPAESDDIDEEDYKPAFMEMCGKYRKLEADYIVLADWEDDIMDSWESVRED